MATKEVKGKNQTDNPEEGKQSGEKVKKSADASPDAEAKEESTENYNEKDSEMAENKNTGETTGQEKTEEMGYAPRVTPEPQNEDQADLRLVSNSVEVSRVSVPVDDDTGQYIDDQDGFKQVQDFIATNKGKKESELKDTELLESGTKLARTFDNKVGLQAAISLGIINKYRLILGMILNILKASFEAINADDENASWMKYYSWKKFKFSLSSAEKYMKLAKIPNIIRWAFLGLERLEKIFTIIKDTVYMATSDPIAAFFEDSNISIDFQEEDLDKWRYTIDEAVTDKKIVMHFEKKNEKLPEGKKVEDTVDRSMIHELISSGTKCNPSLINDLFLYAKGGADPNVLLDDLLESGGKSPSTAIKGTLTDIKTLEGYPKIISELKSQNTYLSRNPALVKKIAPQHVTDLQAQADVLKALHDVHYTAE